jgi:hypothetical protein
VHIGLTWRAKAWADALWRVWYKSKLPDYRHTCENVWRECSSLYISLCCAYCEHGGGINRTCSMQTASIWPLQSGILESKCSEGSSHFASTVVQIMMITRHLCILVKTRTNLIKPDQTSTHYHVTSEQCDNSADSWSDPTLLTAPDITWSHVTSALCVSTLNLSSS